MRRGRGVTVLGTPAAAGLAEATKAYIASVRRLGPADGFMTRGTVYAIIAGLLAAGTVVLAVAAIWQRPTMGSAVGSGVTGGILCGLAAASSIALVSANRNATATSGPPTLGTVLLVASLTALVVFVRNPQAVSWCRGCGTTR